MISDSGRGPVADRLERVRWRFWRKDRLVRHAARPPRLQHGSLLCSTSPAARALVRASNNFDDTNDFVASKSKTAGGMDGRRRHRVRARPGLYRKNRVSLHRRGQEQRLQ